MIDESHLQPGDIFKMTERLDGATVVVALHGELDLATCEPVTERLTGLRAEQRPTVLDLDGLTFIDSSGVRLVLVACEDARKADWPFAVTRGSAEVQRVLAATGVIGDLPYAGSSPGDGAPPS